MSGSPSNWSLKHGGKQASFASSVTPLPNIFKKQVSNKESKPPSLFVIPPKTNFAFTEDIDCEEWLAEIGLERYSATFLTNLSNDGKIILRRRLSVIRLQDLPQMNITDFEHQKAIMAHIRLVLKHPFNSTIRKKEVQVNSPFLQTQHLQQQQQQQPNQRKTSMVKIIRSSDNNAVEPLNLASESKDNEDGANDANNAKEIKDGLGKKSLSTKEKQQKKKEHAKRRRSFDSQIWNSIQSMRNKQQDNAVAADNLREGIINVPKSKEETGAVVSNDGTTSKGNRRRRWSFDPDGNGLNNSGNKAKDYGNLAMEYDMMLKELKELQLEYLNKFKNIIKCEKASIFFINEYTRELVLYTDVGECFRIPPGVGIAGICAETGEPLNIPDAYSDPRFNQ
jgi:hypothetical protein